MEATEVEFITDEPEVSTSGSFLLFAGELDSFGGWKDFKGSFVTEEAAILTAEILDHYWWHVVDLSSMRITATSRNA